MNTRRDFVKTVASAGVVAAFGGCSIFKAGRSDRFAANPPYEDIIQDRLWMWGHGGVAKSPTI